MFASGCPLKRPQLSIIVFLLASFAYSIPAPHFSWGSQNDFDTETGIEPRDSPSLLRILCLGASITYGVGSTTGNGYRKDLRDLLTAAGHTVHFVGTQHGGSMTNNANEGYPGLRIDQVTEWGAASFGYQPDVVLVHLGTNDAVQNIATSVSAANMGKLADNILAAVPNAMIVLSKLLPNNNTNTENNIVALNAALDDVVNTRISNGENLILVDMHSNEFSVSDLGPDGTHPTDEGYSKMAGVWMSAFSDAMSGGRVSAAVATSASDTDDSNNNQCAFTPSEIGSPTAEAFGYGNKSATFKGGWAPKGVILTDKSNKKNQSSTFWADLDGNGLDDYIFATEDGLKVSMNGPAETFGSFTTYSSPPGDCDVSGMRFVDMNGDGVADFVCFGGDGSLTAYYNTGTGGAPSWGSVGTTRASSGQSSNYVADIDGDGLSDYVYVTSGGDVGVSYNLGTGWTQFTSIYTIPSNIFTESEAAGDVYIIDVNGDGRADIVLVNDNAQFYGYMNYRGVSAQQPQFWDSGFIRDDIIDGLYGDDITFGKIRGTKKNDFASLHTDGTVKLYENRGYNGYAYGEYVRFCDMLGVGSDSYLSMGPSGALKLFVNLHNGGFHLKYGQILEDQGVARQDVHLADMNGDGRCDYIVVNNKTGSLQWSENQGVTGGAVNGALALSGATALSNTPSCDSLGIRLADLNGDGLADYVCISRSGEVTVALNNGNGGFSSANSVFSASSDLALFNTREPMSFADIDGDGNADYLFFNQQQGTVSAMLNTGKGLSFGSEQVIYTESAWVSGWMHYANLVGLGRADFVNVLNPLSAKAKYSANRCEPPVPPPVPSSSGSSTTLPFKCTETACGSEPTSPDTYLNVSCNYGSLTSVYNNSTQQWIDAQVLEAWNAATLSWEENQGTSGATFVNYVANFFHTAPFPNCDIVSDTTCGTEINCGQGSEANAAVSCPAGYLIYDSWVGIHTEFYAMYTAIEIAQGAMTDRINGFSSAFSPAWSEDEALKIILDIVGVGFALFAAPTWNSWLKKIPLVKSNGNALGTTKDSVNALVSNSITIVKDKQYNTNSEFSQAAKVGLFLNATISAWMDTTETLLEVMFNGSTSSNELLYSLTDNGGTFYLNGSSSAQEIQSSVEDALYATMIPYAWRNSFESVTPVVLNSSGMPQDAGSTGCDGWHPENVPGRDDTTYLTLMSKGTATQGFVCGADTNNEPYWLLNMNIDTGCDAEGDTPVCNVGKYSDLPGIAELGGAGVASQWGDLSRDDFVVTVLNAYIANGNKNGWDTSLDSASLADIGDGGLRASGIVNIPLCSWQDVDNTVANGDTTEGANWPCP